MIRIAAVGDVHVGGEAVPRLAEGWAGIDDVADVLLLAGDLTKCGHPDEAHCVVAALGRVTVPVVAVLGNHDHHLGRPGDVTGVLRDAGVHVLEGDAVVLDLPAGRLGIAGVKGFGGGFGRAHATAFGEPEMKAFVEHTHAVAGRLSNALDDLRGRDCDAVVALLHYSPVVDTLVGEPCELYPFLGSELFAEAIDAGGVDLAVHGHAHGGSPDGRTAGGVPVRNVAMPVLGCSHRVFELAGERMVSDPSRPRSRRVGVSRRVTRSV